VALHRRPRPEPAGPGQESVWDYPRPPRLARTDAHVVVEFGGGTIADTRHAWRVLETSHPPVFALPRDDIGEGVLQANPRRTVCEFKGLAAYFDVVGLDGSVALAAAWTYPDPTAGYEPLADLVSFYPGQMDRCLVDDEEVQAVQGDFYGGWVTAAVVGPFKGAEPGSARW
jgi:uncharacterized protein (DUF427 family)